MMTDVGDNKDDKNYDDRQCDNDNDHIRDDNTCLISRKTGRTNSC